MVTFNQACDFASQVAFTTKTFKEYELGKLVYKDIKSKFGLGSTATQLVSWKVAQSYKLFKRQEKTYTKRLEAYPAKLAEWDKLFLIEKLVKWKPRKPKPPKMRVFK